jgi:uncharacterized SAM-binding protein YcdF (DUF218 family)
MSLSKKKTIYTVLCLLLTVILMYVFSGMLFVFVGNCLVLDEEPVRSDAIVVLNTGVEYYPRLIESADLFNKGLANKIIINGNRKTDQLRALEERGFVPCCPWYEDSLRILSMYGVQREHVIWISAEDAYDTVSEAEIVGEEILREGLNQIILATSKSHTRRASFIWKRLYGDRLSICTVAAKADPYDREGWWKDGRQIRWVLAEYGAWIYYALKSIGK